MRVLTGRAAIFGIDGTLAYTGVATTRAQIASIGVTHEENMAFIQASNGDTIGAASSNQRQSIQIEFTPTAAPGDQTYTGAITAMVKPTPLAVVALSGFGNSELDGNWNFGGNWSSNLTADGYVRCSMNLLRFNGDALTPVTGNPG